jgi:hypothetical protein
MTAQEEKREKIKAPANAEEVLKLGYGNGWAVTWTFLALARAAGFDASPCLVASRNEYFFRRERLNSSELNTNVVLIQLAGKELYLDPGAAFTPYGFLPWTETGVQGLKLDRDGGKWVATPIPQSDASKIERKAQMKLAEDGSLEGTVKLTFTGLVAQSRRLEERNQDATERKKYLEDELKEAVPTGSEVELKSSGLDRLRSSARGRIPRDDSRMAQCCGPQGSAASRSILRAGETRVRTRGTCLPGVFPLSVPED